MECLKSNFHKNEKMSDGLNNQCRSCGKRYYNKNQEQIRN